MAVNKRRRPAGASHLYNQLRTLFMGACDTMALPENAGKTRVLTIKKELNMQLRRMLGSMLVVALAISTQASLVVQAAPAAGGGPLKGSAPAWANSKNF